MPACVRSPLPTCLLLLLCACPRPPPAVIATAELWVDGAASGGDGTRGRPLRSLEDALGRPGTRLVHLAEGRYPGPLRLAPGMKVVGAGPGTILTASSPDAAVVVAPGDNALESLAVEGGAWGLEAGGPLRLEGVRFKDQRQGAVRQGAGALDGANLRFEAAGGQAPAVGLSLEAGPGATSAPALRLRDSVFLGAFARAVKVRGGGTVRLEGVDFQGPGVALSQEGGEASVERARVAGGAGTAFSVVEGALTLVDVQVQGYEYAVTANRARLSARGFTSEHATRAGLGLTATTGLLEDLVVKDAGSYGALQVTNSDLEVRRFRLEGSREYGVVAVQGRLRLRDGTITDVSTEDGVSGDGLHLRLVTADVDAVTVQGAKGTCILSAQRARVSLRGARLSACGLAALAVDTQAVLEARDVTVRGNPESVLMASEDGELQVEDLTAKEARGELVAADCEGATRVQLRRVDANSTRGLKAPCVQLAPPPRKP
jgi:hypothetical protein